MNDFTAIIIVSPLSGGKDEQFRFPEQIEDAYAKMLTNHRSSRLLFGSLSTELVEIWLKRALTVDELYDSILELVQVAQYGAQQKLRQAEQRIVVCNQLFEAAANRPRETLE